MNRSERIENERRAAREISDLFPDAIINITETGNGERVMTVAVNEGEGNTVLGIMNKHHV